MAGADLIVTNFNANFTGVSATAAAVVREHQKKFDLQTVGHPLPGCQTPISKKAAIQLARHGSTAKSCQIWHVRRNPEMKTALFVRDVLRLPIKIVFTSAAQRLHSAWPRWLISKMDAVIATTNAAAVFVENVSAIIPHGVDTDYFHASTDRAKNWATNKYPGKRGIACIGRIRPEKGTDRFINLAITTTKKFPEVTALVIGRAKPEHKKFLTKLKNDVQRAGLQDKILFVGEIEPTDLPALLRSLSVLVALPRYEGYGMTPLEAMASGVPIIASDTGHFQEFIGNDESGFVAPEGNPDLAAKKLSDILENDTLFSKLANQSVRRVVEHFGIAKEAQRISSVYEEIWNNSAQ